MFGAKTVVALLALAAAVAAARWRGVLDLDYLVALGPASALCAGALAGLGGAAASRAWRLGEPSAHAVGPRLALGALEAPATARHAMAVGAALMIGLIAFDDPATARLVDLPERASISLTRTCPEVRDSGGEPEPEPAAEPEGPPPGCALIVRAHELGYTDDLGSCAPEAAAAPGPEPTEEVRAPERCLDRQRDEPLLHYLWRAARRDIGGAVAAAGDVSVARASRRTGVKLGYLEALAGRQWHAITAAPHASHHLWVNLPPPRAGSWLSLIAEAPGCPGKDASGPVETAWSHRPRPASALLERAFGRLLFDPGSGEPVGYCRDYHIHWDAPADACRRLAADPAGFLEASGALDAVRGALDRLAAARGLRELDAELARAPRGRHRERLPAASELISFQCLAAGETDGKETYARLEVELGGTRFEARELSAGALDPSGAGQLDAYRWLARLLGGAPYAGPLVSESAPVDPASALPPGFLDAGELRLARLEVLVHLDPFGSGRSALEVSPELIEVHPLAGHLRGFVDVFRRRYRAQRRRL